jgi:hypothetical protein
MNILERLLREEKPPVQEPEIKEKNPEKGEAKVKGTERDVKIDFSNVPKVGPEKENVEVPNPEKTGVEIPLQVQQQETQGHLTRNEQQLRQKQLLDSLSKRKLNLREPGLDELIRFLSSDKFNELSEKHLDALRRSEPVIIGDQVFFRNPFSRGSDVAGILYLAQELGKEIVLEDLRRLKRLLEEPSREKK